MENPTKEEISQKVRQIIAEKLGKSTDDIKAEGRFGEPWFTPQAVGEIGDDDLDRMEILMDIEDEFSLEIDDDDTSSWKTVQDVVDYVAGKVGA